ncbi:MAG TPA: hypothetical protein VML19_33615 [Verrucomicrobiae bacterium]|nr:hypothetical protein [Verrucomicrobiae bacterium]
MAKKRPPARSAPAPAKKEKTNTWRRHFPVLAGLWLLMALAYANSFSSGLVYDNHPIIGQDTRIQAVTGDNLGFIWSGDYWNGSGPRDLYRPLTTMSYLVNYAVLGNGTNPAGYHLVNLAFHGLNVALVYLLALWILGEIPAAAILAGLWAVHPVLTESVTNIVGRADLMAAFGVLAALICHIQANRPDVRRRAGWLAGVFLATAFGMFSKESVIVAPVVLLLYDLSFSPGSGWPKRARSYFIAAIPCVLDLVVRARVLRQFTAMAVPFTDNPLTGAGFLPGRLTALSVIGRYIGLLAWPATLSCDYGYRQILTIRPGDIAAVLALAVCLVAGAAVIYAYWKDRRIFFFGGLFFVALAPVANVFLLIGSNMAERFLYLPAIGAAGCAAAAWMALARRLPARMAIAIPAVVCLAFAIRTYARNSDWATDQSLAEATESAAPETYKAHMILATSLSGSRSIAEAGRVRAILDPLPDEQNLNRPYINVGISYRLYGDEVAKTNPGEAVRWYRKSLESLLRGESIAWANDRAIARENARLGRKKVGFAGGKIYLEIATAYARLNEPEKQLEALRRGQTLSDFPEFYFEGMADAYQALGNPSQAAIALMEAVLMNSGQTRMSAADSTQYNRGVTAKLVRLYEKDPKSCAVQTARGIRTVNSQCPQVQADICAAFRDLSRDYPMGARPPNCPAN